MQSTLNKRPFYWAGIWTRQYVHEFPDFTGESNAQRNPRFMNSRRLRFSCKSLLLELFSCLVRTFLFTNFLFTKDWGSPVWLDESSAEAALEECAAGGPENCCHPTLQAQRWRFAGLKIAPAQNLWTSECSCSKFCVQCNVSSPPLSFIRFFGCVRNWQLWGAFKLFTTPATVQSIKCSS